MKNEEDIYVLSSRAAIKLSLRRSIQGSVILFNFHFMSRNAVYRIDPLSIMNDEQSLKKLSLFFDKIYVEKSNAKRFEESDKETHNIPDYVWEMIRIENQILEYLIDNKILFYFEIPSPDNINRMDEEKKLLHELKNLILKDRSLTQIENAKSLDELYKIRHQQDEVSAQTSDLINRVNTMVLERIYDTELIPILKSQKSFQRQGKKEKIVHFLLADIPDPDESTSWEQILDFRSDEETRLKYLALINWVNEIGKSTLTVNEIKDKYEYLYLDYKRNYERHKIKSAFRTLEIIAAGTIGFFTSNVPMSLSLVSNFLKIGTSTLSLLKEEGNLSGKEIAYIYHANRKFNK